MVARQRIGRRAASRRAGLSFTEFVGCIVALVGGLALGSMYLGVDMKSMAVGILQQADIVDPSLLGLTPEDESTAPAAQATADGQAATPQENFLAATDPPRNSVDWAGTVASGRDAIFAPATPTADRAAEPAKDAPQQLTEQDRQQATRTYWNGLAKAIQEEASQRYAAVDNPTEWQLFDYLTHRKKGHQQAVDKLQQLDEHGVDERLVAHGQQVLTWQSAGVDLYGRALGLLTDGPTAKLTGPFAQSWQRAATQHRMEETLVRNKHVGVAGYLDHTYESLAPFVPAAAP